MRRAAICSVLLAGALANIAPDVGGGTSRSAQFVKGFVKGDGCRTRACRDRVLWRDYRAHPMPRCTWERESSYDPRTGESFHGRPWALGRYRIVNPSSSAGGKFQFLPSTWRGVGGRGLPQHASRLRQETLARRLKRAMGTTPWVNC